MTYRSEESKKPSLTLTVRVRHPRKKMAKSSIKQHICQLVL